MIVDGVHDMVTRSLSEPHQLGTIAYQIGYSERQLRRILAERNIHWRPWLAEQRMQAAAELLLTGRYVKHVAPKVGYKADHFAAPFVAYCGLLPEQARRAGQIRRLLTTLKKRPPRSADVAAKCRAIDRWSGLWHEAARLQLRARPGTPVAAVLDQALRCVPPSRPRPTPRGRRRRQVALAELLRSELTAADQHDRMTWYVAQRHAPSARAASTDPARDGHQHARLRGERRHRHG